MLARVSTRRNNRIWSRFLTICRQGDCRVSSTWLIESGWAGIWLLGGLKVSCCPLTANLTARVMVRFLFRNRGHVIGWVLAAACIVRPLLSPRMPRHQSILGFHTSSSIGFWGWGLPENLFEQLCLILLPFRLCMAKDVGRSPSPCGTGSIVRA